jgi:hypothetical protein
MIRAIVLSIALLVGFGGTIILTTDYTEAGAHKPRKQKKKKVKYKKYSRAWWRAYRQRVKRQRELAQRRRAMRLRQIRASRNKPQNSQTNQTTRTEKNPVVKTNTPALLPSGENAPSGWKQGNASSSELNYRVEDDSGAQIGSASISLVGAAANTENQPVNQRTKTVGGVSVNSFRSTVIDRMIKENGWVVNDYQKEIGGKKVYVVVAQSEGAGGVILSRTFYFTEVDGRIYSVATTSTTTSTEKITQESEKVIDSLQRTKTNPQQASNEK